MNSQLKPGCIYDPFGLNRQLVQMMATEACNRLTESLVRKCEAQPLGASRDLGLKNLWEEVCANWQTNSRSLYLYRTCLLRWLVRIVQEADKFDRWMIWLQTGDGAAYARAPDSIFSEMSGHRNDLHALMKAMAQPEPSRSPDQWPIIIEGIANYIFDEFVVDRCMNYENERMQIAADHMFGD